MFFLKYNIKLYNKNCIRVVLLRIILNLIYLNEVKKTGLIADRNENVILF